MRTAIEDIMSVSEREQAMLVHRERRMAIMIAAYAASSTKGANHDIMSVSEREQAMLVHRERRMAIMIAAYAASSTKGANHDIIKERACIEHEEGKLQILTNLIKTVF